MAEPKRDHPSRDSLSPHTFRNWLFTFRIIHFNKTDTLKLTTAPMHATITVSMSIDASSFISSTNVSPPTVPALVFISGGYWNSITVIRGSFLTAAFGRRLADG